MYKVADEQWYDQMVVPAEWVREGDLIVNQISDPDYAWWKVASTDSVHDPLNPQTHITLELESRDPGNEPPANVEVPFKAWDQVPVLRLRMTDANGIVS